MKRLDKPGLALLTGAVPQRCGLSLVREFIQPAFTLFLLAAMSSLLPGCTSSRPTEVEVDKPKTERYWREVNDVLSRELKTDANQLISTLRGMANDLNALPSSGVDKTAVNAANDMASSFENVCKTYDKHNGFSALAKAFANGASFNVLGVIGQLSGVNEDFRKAQLRIDAAAAEFKQAHISLTSKYGFNLESWEKASGSGGNLISDTLFNEFLKSGQSHVLSEEAKKYVGRYATPGGLRATVVVELKSDGTTEAATSTFIGTIKSTGRWDVKEGVLMIIDTRGNPLGFWQDFKPPNVICNSRITDCGEGSITTFRRSFRPAQ